MGEERWNSVSAGSSGSLIKFYDDRSVIHAVGGCSFDFNTGIASQTLGRYLPDTTVIDESDYEARIDYISGASMLLSRDCLETVGLMEGVGVYTLPVDLRHHGGVFGDLWF
ncbi:MAG: GT2 family glycosyltransferase [Candidatus Azotimanducaceae bacterium]|jgi:GT2 family glycosyltransferase